MPTFQGSKCVDNPKDHDCNPFGVREEFVRVQKLKHKLAESALDENPEVCLAAMEELRNVLRVKTLTHKLARAAYGEPSGICLAALDTLTSAIGPHLNNAPGGEEAAPDTCTRLQTLWDSMEPRKKFSVQANKSSGKKLGISLSTNDEKTLVIVFITDGIVNDWNAREPPHRQVQVGDHIVSVNGKTAPLLTLRRTMESASGPFSFEVEPHLRFTITITRGANEKLGLNVENKPNDMTLLVTGVVDGIINKWNASHKGEMVIAGDRICAINGEMALGSVLRRKINDLRGEIALTIARVRDVSL